MDRLKNMNKKHISIAAGVVAVIVIVLIIAISGGVPEYTVMDIGGDEYGNVFVYVTSIDCDSETDAVKIAKKLQDNPDAYKEWIMIYGAHNVDYDVRFSYGKLKEVKVRD